MQTRVRSLHSICHRRGLLDGCLYTYQKPCEQRWHVVSNVTSRRTSRADGILPPGRMKAISNTVWECLPANSAKRAVIDRLNTAQRCSQEGFSKQKANCWKPSCSKSVNRIGFFWVKAELVRLKGSSVPVSQCARPPRTSTETLVMRVWLLLFAQHLLRALCKFLFFIHCHVSSSSVSFTCVWLCSWTESAALRLGSLIDLVELAHYTCTNTHLIFHILNVPMTFLFHWTFNACLTSLFV